MLLIGFLFILVTSIPQVKSENFKPLLYNGWDQTIQSTMLFLGRSTGLATLAILLPATKGNKNWFYRLERSYLFAYEYNYGDYGWRSW